MNKSFKKIGFLLIVIGAFSSFTYNLPVPVRNAVAIAATAFKVKLPPPPPNRGIAGNRVGGASRISSKDPTNEGTKTDRRLTALVPEYRSNTKDIASQTVITKVWGLTANEYPTLWFYIPYTQDSIARIDFILTDGDNPTDRTVYQNAIQPSTQRGIVSFALPKTGDPLAIDKLYQWELKLTMKLQLDREISVKGWIQRASLNSELSDTLKRATPDRQAALYAENGFWYDALDTLAELRRDLPAEQLRQRSTDLAIQQDWKTLLRSVDLGKLSTLPFVN